MKRFGVKASEEEMKKLRAARFGTTAKSEPQTETTKQVGKQATKQIGKQVGKHEVTEKKENGKRKRERKNIKKANLNQVVAQIQQKNNKFISSVKTNNNNWMTKNKNTNRVITFPAAKIPTVQRNTRHVQINNGKRKIYIQQENNNTRFKKRKT
ncbi:hypothetical protein G6F56_013040 [Rhizopus delemar]|nr:hypothetical protein G6F56_013040 [Rhizopus delemar]